MAELNITGAMGTRIKMIRLRSVSNIQGTMNPAVLNSFQGNTSHVTSHQAPLPR
jgi:hypothetical protein